MLLPIWMLILIVFCFGFLIEDILFFLRNSFDLFVLTSLTDGFQVDFLDLDENLLLLNSVFEDSLIIILICFLIKIDFLDSLTLLFKSVNKRWILDTFNLFVLIKPFSAFNFWGVFLSWDRGFLAFLTAQYWLSFFELFHKKIVRLQSGFLFEYLLVQIFLVYFFALLGWVSWFFLVTSFYKLVTVFLFLLFSFFLVDFLFTTLNNDHSLNSPKKNQI